MAKEIEAKFVGIDKAEVIKKIESIGARKIYDERKMRRVVYDLYSDNSWARIRDEGDKITMSYKCVNRRALDGVNEVQVVVDDFEKAREFLKEMGHKEKSYQETLRARYYLDDGEVELDIDTWPGLDPCLEIEAPTKKAVKQTAEKLGFDWAKAGFGAADNTYASVYNVTEDWINNHCPLLTFDYLPPEISPQNKRRHMEG